jgi:enolase
VTQQKEIDEFLIQEDGTESKSKSLDLLNYINIVSM